MHKTILLAVASTLTLTSGMALAAPGAVPSPTPVITRAMAIHAANNEVGLGFTNTQSNYSENVQGSRTGSDTEHGMMPGFDLFGKGTFDFAGVRALYVSMNYTHTSGQTEYTAGSFSESAGHSSNTVTAKLGKVFALDRNSTLTPYLFGGYRGWNRTVPGGVASPENYTSGFIGMGAKYQIAVSSRLVLAADNGFGEVVGGNLTGTVTPFLSNNFATGNQISLRLADRPYYTTGVSADYRVVHHLHMLVSAQYTDFMYGGSRTSMYAGTQPWSRGYTLGMREPSSQTSNLAVGMALAYGF